MQPPMCNQWVGDSASIIRRNRALQRVLTWFGRSYDDTEMCTNRKRSFWCIIARPFVLKRHFTYRQIHTAPRLGSIVTKRGKRSADALPDTLPSAFLTHESSLRARGLPGVERCSDSLDRLVHLRATF